MRDPLEQRFASWITAAAAAGDEVKADIGAMQGLIGVARGDIVDWDDAIDLEVAAQGVRGGVPESPDGADGAADVLGGVSEARHGVLGPRHGALDAPEGLGQAANTPVGGAGGRRASL